MLKTNAGCLFFEGDDGGGAGGAGSSGGEGGGGILGGDGGQQQQNNNQGTVGFANERGEFSEGWLGRIEGLTPENQAGLMKFKTVSDMTKSYVDMQKLLGQKGNMVAIPGADAKPEVISAYRKALGIPEDPSQYNFKPDNLPQGVEWNDSLMEGYKAIALKHNIPPGAMKELAQAQAQFEAQSRGAASDQLAQRDIEQKTVLGKEWGGDFQQNELRVKAAATLVGFDPKEFHSAKEIIAFDRLARMISDDTLKMGEAASTFMNSEGLALDIMRNKANPDHAKYQANDPAIRQKVNDLLSAANLKGNGQ